MKWSSLHSLARNTGSLWFRFREATSASVSRSFRKERDGGTRIVSQPRARLFYPELVLRRRTPSYVDVDVAHRERRRASVRSPRLPESVFPRRVRAPGVPGVLRDERQRPEPRRRARVVVEFFEFFGERRFGFGRVPGAASPEGSVARRRDTHGALRGDGRRRVRLSDRRGRLRRPSALPWRHLHLPARASFHRRMARWCRAQTAPPPRLPPLAPPRDRPRVPRRADRVHAPPTAARRAEPRREAQAHRRAPRAARRAPRSGPRRPDGRRNEERREDESDRDDLSDVSVLP